jgi:hypothetical protein
MPELETLLEIVCAPLLLYAAIIPQYILDWQEETDKRGEQLDAEWQHLQLIESGILRQLDRDLEAYEHDMIISQLGEIRQRMTEIQLELDQGPNWALEECLDD